MFRVDWISTFITSNKYREGKVIVLVNVVRHHCLYFPNQILLLIFFILFLRWAGPRPHIPFPPDLILYVNLVAMGPVHLSPVTWPQAYGIGIPLLR